MYVDIFQIIESLFRTTVQFPLNFLGLAITLLFRPVRASVAAFRRYKGSAEIEIGPVTFLVACLLMVWTTIVSTALPSEGMSGLALRALATLSDTFGAPHVDPTTAPLITIGIGVYCSIFLIEILYRTLNSMLFSEGGGTKTEFNALDGVSNPDPTQPEKLRAVGFYTTGTGAMIAVGLMTWRQLLPPATGTVVENAPLWLTALTTFGVLGLAHNAYAVASAVRIGKTGWPLSVAVFAGVMLSTVVIFVVSGIVASYAAAFYQDVIVRIVDVVLHHAHR